MAGVLPGLGSSVIRGPYAGWQLGQVFGSDRNVIEWPPGLVRRGPLTGEVAKAVEPTAPATEGVSHFYARSRERAAGRGQPGRRQEAGRAAEAAHARAVRGP